MKYFQNITDLEHAKKQYRKFAMQLHPDKGGSAIEFQQMQKEYKLLLLKLQDYQIITDQQHKQEYNDIIEELSKLAKVLIEKQVPQDYLKRKIENSQSSIEKTIFSGIIGFLDKL
jgi:curved DNA-binding protein CbpA